MSASSTQGLPDGNSWTMTPISIWRLVRVAFTPDWHRASARRWSDGSLAWSQSAVRWRVSRAGDNASKYKRLTWGFHGHTPGAATPSAGTQRLGWGLMEASSVGRLFFSHPWHIWQLKQGSSATIRARDAALTKLWCFVNLPTWWLFARLKERTYLHTLWLHELFLIGSHRSFNYFRVVFPKIMLQCNLLFVKK